MVTFFVGKKGKEPSVIDLAMQGSEIVDPLALTVTICLWVPM